MKSTRQVAKTSVGRDKPIAEHSILTIARVLSCSKPSFYRTLASSLKWPHPKRLIVVSFSSVSFLVRLVLVLGLVALFCHHLFPNPRVEYIISSWLPDSQLGALLRILLFLPYASQELNSLLRDAGCLVPLVPKLLDHLTPTTPRCGSLLLPLVPPPP
jgi:hypothetical protein